jgi:DNA helicase-2/ATP-dependent DNA helicase PcrA
VINVPPRGIGDKTIVGLDYVARQAKTSPGAVLLDMGVRGDQSPFWSEFKGRGAILLADFGAMLSRWVEMAAGPLTTLFDKILEDAAYQPYLDDVQEVRKLAYEFQERGLAEFLENLALVSDQDTVPETSSAPTLLTLHAAKGLEFPQVFICGLDEGLLPHSRSLDDPEEMAEERRLFYVGLTRAKNHIFLVHAGRRSTYGSFEDTVQSRFLADIPDGLLEQQGLKREERRQRLAGWDEDGSSSSGWGRKAGGANRSVSRSPYSKPGRSTNDSYRVPPPPRQEPPKPAVAQLYRATMRISHAVWGEGIILESKIDDGEEVVDVIFKSVGFKRLIASLAKLQIL